MVENIVISSNNVLNNVEFWFADGEWFARLYNDEHYAIALIHNKSKYKVLRRCAKYLKV